MRLVVRPYTEADYARVLEICIAAFEPMHQGFEQKLGSRIFEVQYRDWREQYAKRCARFRAADMDKQGLCRRA